MKITKTLANDITDQLVKAKQLALKKEREQLELDIKNSLLKLVPEDLIKVFKKYPEYFISQASWREDYFYTNPRIPHLTDGYLGYRHLHKDDMEDIKKRVQQVQIKEKDISKNRDNIYISILTFTTTNRLKEGFPEAYKVVEKDIVSSDGKLLPSKNIEPLRQWLKQS